MHLVDTDGHGVDRITEKGVVVGDTEYEVDCLIYASGFETNTDYNTRVGFDPIGRDGVVLARSRPTVRTPSASSPTATRTS